MRVIVGVPALIIGVYVLLNEWSMLKVKLITPDNWMGFAFGGGCLLLGLLLLFSLGVQALWHDPLERR